MATFFGRVKKMPGGGFLGTRLPMPIRPTRGPAPDTRDRGPNDEDKKNV